MRREVCLALALGLAVGMGLGCASSHASSPSPISADLEMLCARVKARRISAWSQPVYQTPALGPLTMRVDAGDEAARCELGQWMRAHAPKACRGILQTLRRSCA